jgi:hypothetical protein
LFIGCGGRGNSPRCRGVDLSHGERPISGRLAQAVGEEEHTRDAVATDETEVAVVESLACSTPTLHMDDFDVTAERACDAGGRSDEGLDVLSRRAGGVQRICIGVDVRGRHHDRKFHALVSLPKHHPLKGFAPEVWIDQKGFSDVGGARCTA